MSRPQSKPTGVVQHQASELAVLVTPYDTRCHAAPSKRAGSGVKGTVEVVEILTEVGGRIDFGPPKTKASKRQVALPPFLTEIFAGLLEAHSGGPNDVVFVGREGGPLRRTNFRKRHWLPALERAELPMELRFHDLRHTCAALLIAQGAHPKEFRRGLVTPRSPRHSTATATSSRAWTNA